MKNITLLMAIFFMTLIGTGTVTADGYAPQKVVYHINDDDPKKQVGALRSIQNHIKAVGADKLELRVVLYGNGLSLLLDPDSLDELTKFKHANATEIMTARVDGLKSQGVKFNVCENTIKGRNVDVESDLYDVSESDIVPSGVAELAKLQAQGFTYIKP